MESSYLDIYNVHQHRPLVQLATALAPLQCVHCCGGHSRTHIGHDGPWTKRSIYNERALHNGGAITESIPYPILDACFVYHALHPHIPKC